MKKITNKMIIVFILTYIVFSYINPLISNKVYASSKTKEEIGEYIAQFAENFANSSAANETIYSWNAEQRAAAYRGEKCSGTQETYTGNPRSFTDKYAMDCVGWVSFVIHQATGLDVDVVRSGSQGFVSPQFDTDYSNGYFETLKTNDWKRGDILISKASTHVMIYIGNNKVVDCIDPDIGNAVAVRDMTYTIDSIGRITDKGVKAIKDSALTTIFNGYGSLKNNVDFDKYYGLLQGEYVGSTSLFKFPDLESLLDWIIGIMTMGIKVQFIGWSNIVENLITDTLNGVTNNDNIVVDENQQLGLDQKAKLTVEAIVFNKVQLLDANIFDLENSAGAPLDKDGIIYILKENIANWYYVFRQIGIIGLLITLIYIGIRMAISTIAEEKAKYKKMLVNWVVSFIIVYFIHYFMIAVISVNNIFVDLFAQAANIDEVSLYETIKTKAYEVKFSTGFGATIIYMVLLYILIKYLFIYIKRWLLISILTVIAPVLGIAYSIQKIKDNKSKALTNWMNDYVQAVFTQTFHALVYTVFIYIALKLAMTSLSGMVISLFFLNFMAKADKIIRDIFKFGGKGAQNMMKHTPLKDLANNSIVAGIAIQTAKVPLKATKKAAIWTANTALGRSQFAKDVKKQLGTTNEIKDRQTEAWVKGVKENWGMIKDDVGTVANAVIGAGTLMAAVPAMVVEPDKGIALAYLAKNRLDAAKPQNKKIYGYKRKANKKASKNISKNMTMEDAILSRYSEDGFSKNAFGHYYNPWTDEYDPDYDPTKDKMYINQAKSYFSSIKAKEKAEKAERRKTYTRKVRKVASFVTGGYAFEQAFEKAEQRSEKNIKIKTNIEKERQSLARAQGIIGEIEQELFNRNKEADTPMKQALTQLNNESLKQNIEDEFKQVSKDDIDQTVNEYMKKNNKERLTEADMENIVKELSDRLEENTDLKDERTIIRLDTQKLKANIDQVVAELDSSDLTNLDPNNITTEEMQKILGKAVARTGSIEKANIDDANKHIIEKLRELKKVNKDLKENKSQELDCEEIIENIMKRVGENEK